MPNQHTEWLRSLIRLLGDYKDLRVLDVGCEVEGALVSSLKSDFEAKEAIGINPIVDNCVLASGAHLLKGDICKTTFEDCSFDLIISSSAFEHIQNLDLALKEMHRILKPDGLLYSHHGPIWSTSYGHHLWLPNGITYWNLILPPYCHLLMLEEELAQWLLEHYPDQKEAISPVLNWVYRDPGQNRLMFSDHLIIYKESPFETIFFKGYDHYELSKKYTPFITRGILQALRSKYPNENGFYYDGISVLLKK